LYLYPRRRSPCLPLLLTSIVFILILGGVLAIALGRAPKDFRPPWSLAAAPAPTATGEPVATAPSSSDQDATGSDTSTPRPAGLTPTKTPIASATLMPTPTPIDVVTHFILGRPVGPDAVSSSPDRTYLYGDTQHGTAAVHHGEEFVNPIGTPLLAVADGTIVVAGNDHQPRCGDDGAQLCGEALNFYGNLVVVKLDQTFRDQAVFTLCGHMNLIAVKVGQHVRAGDPIGTVGDTGVAIGPHCHFEVRLGSDDYAHTRNPILWMKPLPGTGAVAGIVQDRNGTPLRGVNVFLFADNATQDYVQDTETYGRDAHPLVNSDDQMHENWAMGDLRAGKYVLRVQIGQLNYARHITIEDGQLTFEVFGGP
jgi:murein DD-endopeptidase MepM/ murein hydrolase activator NlpD